MENQMNVGNQNAQQIGQNPVSQPVTSPEKPKINYLMIAGIVLVCFVIFGFGGYYLGKQSSDLQPSNNINRLQPTPTENSQISASPTAANIPVANKITLIDALSKYCTNNKIDLDKLPFTLTQNLKNAYKVQNTIGCYVPEESHASMSIIVNTPDFSGNERVTYFFHENSKFFGMGNDFQPLSNYNPVTINGKNYWLNVRDPGPYGISTLSVWVDIIGEKKDPTSGTIVRVIDNERLKNQDLLDLVKKYGVKQSEPSGPEYIITDSNKKAQFIQEIVNLAPQHSAFKKPALDVSSDLNGISF